MAFKGPRRSHAPEQKEFHEEVIQIDRVTRVVKGGRRLRFRATVVIGNRKGKVGLGVGKSTEVANAIQKAISKAKKSILEIPIYRGTIPHRVNSKYKSSRILMMPASEGTGLIAGGAMRKVVELAGIRNIISKSLGSSNKINNAKAAIDGLLQLKRLPKLLTDFEGGQKNDREGKRNDNQKQAGNVPKKHEDMEAKNVKTPVTHEKEATKTHEKETVKKEKSA